MMNGGGVGGLKIWEKTLDSNFFFVSSWREFTNFKECGDEKLKMDNWKILRLGSFEWGLFLLEGRSQVNTLLHDMIIPCYSSQMFLWHCDVVVNTTAQLHSTKPELRFRAVSNPASGVSETCDGEDLWK